MNSFKSTSLTSCCVTWRLFWTTWTHCKQNYNSPISEKSHTYIDSTQLQKFRTLMLMQKVQKVT